MSSSENKTCAICLGSVTAGQGKAVFTAECSHSFHFNCISSSVQHGNYLCPVCRAKWNDLPFVLQNLPPNATTATQDHALFDLSPNPFLRVPRPHPMLRAPILEPEPTRFFDDEPTADQASNDSPAHLQNVVIRAIPERPAVAASESMPRFAVLVGLRAPPLSADALHAQRAPIDLITVLDVSGSMHSSKLALLKRAMIFVIENLGPCDRLSIVSFSTLARRILPLRRMTEHGREDAKRAVNSLTARGSTNIVDGLKKGVQVLEERLHHNPVSSIIFLSDGRDTCNGGSGFHHSSTPRHPPPYLHLLPSSICPRNRGTEDGQIFPVHAFGFGSDHDPIAMHAISDSSGGTFSFIESYETVQDAFASCIGGLLSVVTQELRLTVRSASHGVEIVSIPSGRYASEVSDQGSRGTINVGDLYADEEKEFLINLSVPILTHTDGEESERKTSLLDVTCTYKDVVSRETVQADSDLVEIRRPEFPSSDDTIVNLEVDRQRNRLSAAESIAEAQRMAEAGNLGGAQTLLSNRRSSLLASASGQSGDGLCMWLEAEMKETEERMGSRQMYERAGRAYALSSMSAHGYQRANTVGSNFTAAPGSFQFEVGGGGFSGLERQNFGGYMTPNMARMVNRSRELNKSEDAIQE